MQNYVRGKSQVRLVGYKIRIIRETLSNLYNLESSEIILVYKNLILHDCHRLDYYNIKHDEKIWFGKLNEYIEEFGHHIVVKLKARSSPDNIGLTEKVLLKKSQRISDIRIILTKIFKWLENIPLCDSNDRILNDDETIEDCNLIDNSDVIVGTPIFVLSTGKESNESLIDVSLHKMRLGFYEMSPLMEILRKITVSRHGNKSTLINILDFIDMKKLEDSNVKSQFVKFITDWVDYFDRLERNESTTEDKTSIYRQDFGGHLEDIDDSVELVTGEDHTECMYNLFDTLKKCVTRYFSFFPLGNIINSMTEIFNAFKRRKSSRNDEIFVDVRLGKQLNYFFQKLLDDGEPSNLDEQKNYTFLIEQIFPLLQDINRLIHDYWNDVNYFGENKFSDVFIKPSLNEDNPIHVMSAGKLTVAQTKDIVEKILSKESFIVTKEFDEILSGDETVPSDAIVPYFSVTKNINNFTKIKNLGTGGFGTVDLYENTLNNSERVLKQIKMPHNKGINEVKEIMREIITTFKMAPHRRIIQYLGFHLQDEYFYIEMEYMKEGSLKQYVDKKGKLSDEESRHFSKQTLEGLNYLHSKSILHRDIKAENILLNEDKSIRLTDFGLARCFDISLDNVETSLGINSEGTERYMAPEFSKSGKYGSPSDVWSFGITVIVMITGNTPFHDLSPSRAQERLLQVNLEKYIKSSNKHLKEFIISCLKEKPEERQSVDKLLTCSFISKHG